MDRLEFEADLRRDGYRIVNSSVQPNLVASNHCHDFDAKAFVLGGEITITRDNNPVTFRADSVSRSRPAACMPSMWVRKVLPCCQADAGRRPPHPGGIRKRPAPGRLRGHSRRQKADTAEDLHAHDFDVRIMVLGGEITVTRDGKPETFTPGDHCEIAEGCQHTTKVGPEGVAFMVGKAYRRAAAAA